MTAEMFVGKLGKSFSVFCPTGGFSVLNKEKTLLLLCSRTTQVLSITHDVGTLGEHDVLEDRAGGQSNPERENSQRRGFLRELHAMIRLRSPHTVGVYGAITSRPDRLVLVMELLPGGDLRTLLKKSEQPIPEERSRQIIRDICAGMHFLHGKDTVHGDLKSANVLLDGAGRAKVRDTVDANFCSARAKQLLESYRIIGGSKNSLPGERDLELEESCASTGASSGWDWVPQIELLFERSFHGDPCGQH